MGSVGRYWCSGVIDVRWGETFPWGTLAVNVIGSATIGLLAAFAVPEGRLLLSSPARQFLMVGMLGGFTTFSSFSLQSLNLMQEGEWGAASIYVLGSVVVCLFGVWLGLVSGGLINR